MSSTGPSNLPTEPSPQEEALLGELRQMLRPLDLGRLGTYELIREVSRGGQGVVYRAYQPATKRHVALKRLIGGALAGEAALARFHREVEAVAALDHPNIVTVYGVEWLDGRPILAMQWIEGVNIDAWSRGSGAAAPSIEARLRMFVQVCDAVQHAHQRGVIHRDLKPANIMVCDGTTPKVLDFGVAKLATDDSANLTHTGEFVGTPAYAAPEQVAGTARAIDTRTDQYALGVILFNMLTGVMPYATTDSLTDLMYTIQHVEARRPSTMNPRLPRDLDAIVLKTLEKERERRYPSIDALAADIRRFVAGEVVQAAPPSRLYRLGKLVRRHRWSVALGSAAAAAVIATAIVAIVYAIKFAGQKEIAESAGRQALIDRNAAQRDSRIANSVSGVLTRMLTSADAWSGKTGKPAREVRVVDVLSGMAAELDGGSLRNDPMVESSLRGTLGGTFESLGMYDEAARQWGRALELRRSTANGPIEELADAMRCYAYNLCSAGRHEQGQIEFDRAIGTYERIFGAEDIELARTLQWSASLLLAEKQLDKARPRLERALEISRKSNGDEQLRASLSHALGLLAQRQQDYPAAARMYQEVVDLMRKRHAGPHPDVAAAISNLANVTLELGELDRAEALLDEAIDMSRACFGDPHPELAKSLTLKALLRHKQGLTEDAIRIAREALSMQQKLLPEDHVDILSSRNFLAKIGAPQ